MAAFDAGQAAAAYMARLSPAALDAAAARTQGDHWLLLVRWSILVGGAILIQQLAILDGVKRRIERNGPRPHLTAFCCVMTVVAAEWAAQFPWMMYAEWWRPREWGFTHTSFAEWLAVKILVSELTIGFVALLGIPVYALMRRWPRVWWIFTAEIATVAILAALIIGPTFIEPLLASRAPMPEGMEKTAIIALARRANFPVARIQSTGQPSDAADPTLDRTEWPSSNEVILDRRLFTVGANIAQTRAIVGEKISALQQHQILWRALAYSVLVTIALWIVHALFPWVAPRLGARPGGLIADPATLPIVLIILAPLMLLTMPILYRVNRTLEDAVDAATLTLTSDPDGLARSILASAGYENPSPSPLEEVIFYAHPSAQRRVHVAMLWKAQHLAANEP